MVRGCDHRFRYTPEEVVKDNGCVYKRHNNKMEYWCYCNTTDFCNGLSLETLNSTFNENNNVINGVTVKNLIILASASSPDTTTTTTAAATTVYTTTSGYTQSSSITNKLTNITESTVATSTYHKSSEIPKPICPEFNGKLLK